VHVTLSDQTLKNLDELQDLKPGADMADLISEAIADYVEKTRARKAALTKSPRPANSPTPGQRHIPAAIKREVWTRDQGRCTFDDGQGHRCTEKRFIEFHHIHPFGKGGQHSPENLALRCRAHNQYQAVLDYGASCTAFRNPPPF